jgi:drug/metabolite transporter (DMT)-like permease
VRGKEGTGLQAATWGLIWFTVVAWAVWGIILKLGLAHGDPLSLVVWSGMMAGLMAPAGWLVLRHLRAPLATDLRLVLWAALGVVISTAAGWTYTLALARAPAGLVTALTASYPALTMALGAVVLGEHPTPPQLAGLALTAVGVWLLSR